VAVQRGLTLTESVSSNRYVGDDLSAWRPAHETTTRIEDGMLVVSDSNRLSYHLVRIYDSEFLYRLVSIKCLVKFLPTATTNFYVHHVGDMHVAEIGADGTVFNRGICSSISAKVREDGLLEIEVKFLNCHGSLSLGCSEGGRAVYTGTGRDQFALVDIVVETFDATVELSRVPADERITLVDVGGQEGLQQKWMVRANQITPVVFEPIPSEAATLRQTLTRIPGAKVVERALAHASGVRKLYIAEASGCSSLRQPNHELLQRYSIGRIFRTVGTLDVECVRYDELFHHHIVPSPDVIKIDVQGFEYEVLTGFGELLQSCLAIELETHFVPIYRDQKLIGDIVRMLEDFDFSLRELRQVPNFDGDAVEFDAFFTKRCDRRNQLSEIARKKLSVITDVWRIAP
jgi:FkbM family methyltransferase